jgi:hypothetical protein
LVSKVYLKRRALFIVPKKNTKKGRVEAQKACSFQLGFSKAELKELAPTISPP